MSQTIKELSAKAREKRIQPDENGNYEVLVSTETAQCARRAWLHLQGLSKQQIADVESGAATCTIYMGVPIIDYSGTGNLSQPIAHGQ